VNRLRTLERAVITFLLIVVAAPLLKAETNLQVGAFYKCGGERVYVSSCLNELDSANCMVVYPDRPLRNGFEVQDVENRGTLRQKIQNCQQLTKPRQLGANSAKVQTFQAPGVASAPMSIRIAQVVGAGISLLFWVVSAAQQQAGNRGVRRRSDVARTRDPGCIRLERLYVQADGRKSEQSLQDAVLAAAQHQDFQAPRSRNAAFCVFHI
jgi:hypothetical protein